MHEKIAKLRSKKGVSTIEVVIGAMVFILIFGFMLDLIMLTWKFNVISQTNTQFARVAGLQGGILAGPPSQWPGGANNYVGTGKMKDIIYDSFESAGIKRDDISIEFPFGTRYEYGKTFKTKITVRYQWEYMSMMLPGSWSHSISSSRPAISEWKYNYNSGWEGE